MQNTKAIVTNNRTWGFFGTIKTNLGLSDGQAGEAYAQAGQMIVEAFGTHARETTVKLLDSKTGRHIADQIDELPLLQTRLASILKKWSRQLRRELEEIEEELDSPPSTQDLLERLSADRHKEVRTAYYKAAEGLTALQRALAAADAEVGGGTELRSFAGLAAAADRMLSQTCLGTLL